MKSTEWPDSPSYFLKSTQAIWGGHEGYIVKKDEFYAIPVPLGKVLFPSIFGTTLNVPVELLLIDRMLNWVFIRNVFPSSTTWMFI